MPATLAGTTHNIALHHDVQASDVASASDCQSPMSNVFDTIRVPGFSSSRDGRSLRLMFGSRNSVITVAFDRSASYRSPWVNVALSDTPASFAFRWDRATMSGLNSTPCARAPFFAALITVMPSPDPRSIR